MILCGFAAERGLMKNLNQSDPLVSKIIEKESRRQIEGLELIPSENYVSEAVLEAMGSIMTNKYSEGYPHKRYYGGQEFTDELEELAIKRAQELFKTDYHVNVQPYSGSPANLEVYFALLEFGDKVLGMSLVEGGHLTHGNQFNFSGKAYNFVSYGVGKNGKIDYEEVRQIALKEKPKLIISGATAYPRQIDFQKFNDIAREVGAYHMADISHIAGLIAGGVHPSPFGPPACGADVVTTTTHKTLRGPRGAVIFCKPELAEKIDKAVFPGMQGGPHMHQIAAKAVCFKEAAADEFKEYAAQIIKNSQALAGELINRGYNLISGGSDNHLILMKLEPGSGIFAQTALDEAGITLNKNTIPKEPSSPFYPSGIRLGTPAVTSRNMKEQDMIKIAGWIDRTLQITKKYILPENKEERKNYIAEAKKEIKNDADIKKIKNEVAVFAGRFPLPGLKGGK
jgi:glycine hydroxymethyltransferase